MKVGKMSGAASTDGSSYELDKGKKVGCPLTHGSQTLLEDHKLQHSDYAGITGDINSDFSGG